MTLVGPNGPMDPGAMPGGDVAGMPADGFADAVGQGVVHRGFYGDDTE